MLYKFLCKKCVSICEKKNQVLYRFHYRIFIWRLLWSNCKKVRVPGIFMGAEQGAFFASFVNPYIYLCFTVVVTETRAGAHSSRLLQRRRATIHSTLVSTLWTLPCSASELLTVWQPHSTFLEHHQGLGSQQPDFHLEHQQIPSVMLPLSLPQVSFWNISILLRRIPTNTIITDKAMASWS